MTTGVAPNHIYDTTNAKSKNGALVLLSAYGIGREEWSPHQPKYDPVAVAVNPIKQVLVLSQPMLQWQII